MGSDTETAVAEKSHRGPWWPVVWIVVLLLIGAVQVLRVQWFDAAVFLAASALLAFDSVRGASRVHSGASRTFAFRARSLRARCVWITAAFVGVAACLLPRHSIPMRVLVCAVGVTVIALAWAQGRGHVERWSPGLRRLAWVWGTLFVLGCVWELSQFLIGLNPQITSYALSDLLNPFLATWAGKASFALLWLAFGAYLQRRGP